MSSPYRHRLAMITGIPYAISLRRAASRDTGLTFGREDIQGGVMGEHLNVDPVDLHMSSDHMDVHHAELQAAHTAANGVIEGAQAGWVGTSAGALQAKFVEWQEITENLTSNIAAHGAAFQDAANGYEKGDSQSAEKLNGQL